jgi:putative membrane protein insertion efficiency factor
MSRIIIAIIHVYRWMISPFLPPRCRFDPTCSRYAINALETHGLRRGLVLVARRLLRCHPYEKLSKQLGEPFGYDPVPFKNNQKSAPKIANRAYTKKVRKI